MYFLLFPRSMLLESCIHRASQMHAPFPALDIEEEGEGKGKWAREEGRTRRRGGARRSRNAWGSCCTAFACTPQTLPQL